MTVPKSHVESIVLTMEQESRERRRAWQLVTFGDDQLFVRPGTTDLLMARSCLIDREFDGIALDGVRVVVDCGACIGASTVAFSNKFPAATVIAVEPEFGNFELLESNTLARPNVERIRAAVAGAPGTRMVLDPCIGAWGYTVVESQRHLRSMGQSVPAITINALLERYRASEIDILKLDVEGAEKELFESSVDWIDRVRALVVELHDRYVPGCAEAFQRATRHYSRFESCGEKWIAYR